MVRFEGAGSKCHNYQGYGAGGEYQKYQGYGAGNGYRKYQGYGAVGAHQYKGYEPGGEKLMKSEVYDDDSGDLHRVIQVLLNANQTLKKKVVYLEKELDARNVTIQIGKMHRNLLSGAENKGGLLHGAESNKTFSYAGCNVENFNPNGLERCSDYRKYQGYGAGNGYRKYQGYGAVGAYQYKGYEPGGEKLTSLEEYENGDDLHSVIHLLLNANQCLKKKVVQLEKELDACKVSAHISKIHKNLLSGADDKGGMLQGRNFNSKDGLLHGRNLDSCRLEEQREGKVSSKMHRDLLSGAENKGGVLHGAESDKTLSYADVCRSGRNFNSKDGLPVLAASRNKCRRPCKYCDRRHKWGSKNCFAFGKECRRCSGKNHFASVCWNKKKTMSKCNSLANCKTSVEKSLEYSEKAGITEVGGISIPNRMDQIQKEDVASVNENKVTSDDATNSDNSEEDDKVYTETQMIDKNLNVKGKSDENPDDENISEKTVAMEKWVANEFVLISKRKKMSKGSTEKEKWRAAANERQRTFMEQWL